MNKEDNNKISNYYSHVLIIGNGFDLDLGLPTKYTDFLDSIPPSDLSNPIINYLKNKKEINGWVDIENELAKYSLESRTNKFRKYYTDLCQKLTKYLDSIQSREINMKSNAYKVLKKFDNFNQGHDFKLLILDFNYTNTIKLILNEFEHEIDRSYVKVHGSIESNNIIFGVQDSANYYKAYSFIRKSYYDNSIRFEISDKLYSSDAITIFGHSLGLSDHHYFDTFFTKETKNIRNSDSTITIFCYSVEDKDKIQENLNILTNNNVKKLRISRNLRIFTLKKEIE